MGSGGRIGRMGPGILFASRQCARMARVRGLEGVQFQITDFRGAGDGATTNGHESGTEAGARHAGEHAAWRAVVFTKRSQFGNGWRTVLDGASHCFRKGCGGTGLRRAGGWRLRNEPILKADRRGRTTNEHEWEGGTPGPETDASGRHMGTAETGRKQRWGGQEEDFAKRSHLVSGHITGTDGAEVGRKTRMDTNSMRVGTRRQSASKSCPRNTRIDASGTESLLPEEASGYRTVCQDIRVYSRVSRATSTPGRRPALRGTAPQARRGEPRPAPARRRSAARWAAAAGSRERLGKLRSPFCRVAAAARRAALRGQCADAPPCGRPPAFPSTPFRLPLSIVP